MENNSFNPIFTPAFGKESKILNSDYNDGWVYFATDSKKIYLDADGQSKLPMGGTSGIYYGNLVINKDDINEGQTEFIFTIDDLERDENGRISIPNKNDLILNIDGCFYKVISVENNEIITNKLTIAGSGGGDVPSSGATVKFNFITPQEGLTVLYKRDYNLQLGVTVTTKDGELILQQGSYELLVQNRKVGEGPLYQDQINSIPIGEFLTETTNSITIKATVNLGNGAFDTRTLKYNIKTTEASLTWNYEKNIDGSNSANKIINFINEDFVLDYNITGNGSKKATLLINDMIPIDLGTFSGNAPNYVFTPDLLAQYNIGHGAHKFTLSASIILNNIETPLGSITKNVVFVDLNNPNEIISCDFFDTTVLQYNTVFIPISIYSTANINNSAQVEVLVDGAHPNTFENMKNGEIRNWVYTPIEDGAHLLTINYGKANKNLNIEVQSLNINNKEVPNYDFKLKINELANQEALQSWNSNGVTLSFSEDFDWRNGGIDKSGQYLNIKAGSYMTIKYPLFKNFMFGKGRTFKMIFKTHNCRDYDARFLKCSKDRKKLVQDSEQLYLPIENGTEVQYSDQVDLNQESLIELKSIVYDRDSEDCRKELTNKYMLYNNIIYRCYFEKIDEEDESWSSYWRKINFVTDYVGLEMRAQSATLNSQDSTISTQYCEDARIEFEYDIGVRDIREDIPNPRNYLKIWIDGVPAGYTIYSHLDNFNLLDDEIVIGSEDCDIHVYLVKVYNKSLSDSEHLQNFIADAPSAEDMLSRYKRNDILDDNRKTEISYAKLAKANPDCLVHLYEISRMTKNKKDPVRNCVYDQYQGSDTSKLHAEGVTIKVQGTSSEKYVIAAANIDTNFMDDDPSARPTGLMNPETGEIYKDGWKMDENALPVNYTCTKVNVASCENVNNAMNQEWYNLFQPYQSVLRCKDSKMRDTMQFTNGVIFIKDKNPDFDKNAQDAKTNNIFGETVVNGISYLKDPYYKMYSLGQMGNSKNNIHVFHDLENENECCIEVSDNQSPQQWMVDYEFNNDIDNDDNKYFEFRYAYNDSPTEEMQSNWKRFVTWMATSNPSRKYKAHVEKIELTEATFEPNVFYIKTKNGHYIKALSFNPQEIYYKNLVTNQSKFNQISKNWKTLKDIPVYKMNDEKTEYIKVDNYDPNVTIYYTETEHKYGATDLKLSTPKTFGSKKFEGFKTNIINPQTNEPYQKNYNPLIAGCEEDTYAGTYEYDTYEYRMAKMLAECEDHLIMDSIVYHYLFIERHCMIDNVAKNTFWSTEDGQHWNMIKDYDNDTADGNDNNGKFTRTYGMEPLDELNDTEHVFNAHQSVWLNFIHGLTKTKQEMYQRLDAVEKVYKGKTVKLWKKDDYLWACSEWQSRIPERCWIEDYYRKYIRPYEIYNSSMFNSMIEGGQKKYQRQQYETYQNIYMSSEYFGSECKSSYVWLRTTGSGLLKYKIPTQVYSDCYIYVDIGQQKSRQRVKRNEWNVFTMPQDNINNATMSFFPASSISILGRTGTDGGRLSVLNPAVFSTQSQAGKLRELVFSTKDDVNDNNELFDKDLDIGATELLEKLYVANFTAYTQGLNLSQCINLKELDASNSTFKDVILPDNAPIESILLYSPTSLKMSNLFKVDNFNITDYTNLKTLDLDNVDYQSIDSKSIVEKSLGLKLEYYNLNNINWRLSAPEDVNSTDNTIEILEKLLTKKTFEEQNGSKPKSTSLTGTLIIPESVYNESNSFDIYSKYAQSSIYPNLDIIFEGSNAKLYNITIYDGDSKIFWHKKISPNNNIDDIFLSNGPLGAFNPERLHKAPTAEFIFEFTHSWKMYKNKDLSDEPEIIEGDNPYVNNITSDIILVPQFKYYDRPYTLTFYGDDGVVLDRIDNAKYGMTWAEVNARLTQVPYREAPSELKRAWNFEGYGLIAGSTNVVPDNYIVNNNQNFYAIFKIVEDISTVVHPEWFSAGEAIYFDDKEYANGNDNDPVPNYIPGGYKRVRGYILRPKYGLTLKGKVTIPAEYNNLPVVGIEAFNDQQITHLFCEKNSNLYVIKSNTFTHTNPLKPGTIAPNAYLEYFDFSQNTVRAIESNAFNTCTQLNPHLFNLSTNLYYVGSRAFNGALRKDAEPVTINIPGNVALVHGYGFNNFNLTENNENVLNVGSPIDLSKIELAYPGVSSQDHYRKFTANDNYYSYINFYTSKYSDFSDPIIQGGEVQVSQCFLRNGQNINLYIGTGD